MRRIYAAILLVTLFALPGCGIDNTMYNAKKYFASAQVRPLGANGRPAPQAVSDYTKAIKKCGIILSDGGKGKRADDALYLMARALYYKGNSAFQAKDAFENLIKGYPNSKHVPEAYIYLGRVLREINQDAESEALLERFVRNPKYLKHHPRALLVMADYEILDEDYHRAQFWLERIIKDYPKTPEFKEAAFLFGKNYYMQGNFERSLQEFETFINTRGIPKLKKLEAKYYIALNRLEMGNHAKALKEAKYLVRNDERPEMLSRARVLYGRALLATGEIEAGLEELKAVTTSYPRTENSAAAYYYWGNYLYHEEGKINEAVPHLNRVRTEFAKSPLAEKGTQMATAINKTKPGANLNSSRDLQAWLDFHYLKAENLISPLAMPDSALATYQRVINERDSLVAIQDSLLLKIDKASSSIDSLIAILPVSPETTKEDSLSLLASADLPDSLAADIDRALPAEVTDLGSEPSAPDSLDAGEKESSDQPYLPDLDQSEESPDKGEIPPEERIETQEPEPASSDSIDTDTEEKDSSDQPLKPDLDLLKEPLDEGEITPEDSLDIQEPKPVKSGAQLLKELQRDLSAWQQKTDELQASIERFDTQIVPFCYFSKYSLLRKFPNRAEEAESLYQTLLEEYPRNMYSAAATAIKEGRTPRLVDPAYNEALAAFDAALDSYPESPDSLVALMQAYTESAYDDLKLRANYRLGWHYSFEEPDTTLAREYLGYVLNDSENAEYKDAVRRFFDGEAFLLRDSGLVDSTAVMADSLATLAEPTEPTELTGESPADSLSFEIDLPEAALPDSLLKLTEPAVPDSLSGLQPEPEIQSEESGTEPETAPSEAEEATPLDALPPETQPDLTE